MHTHNVFQTHKHAHITHPLYHKLSNDQYQLATMRTCICQLEDNCSHALDALEISSKEVEKHVCPLRSTNNTRPKHIATCLTVCNLWSQVQTVSKLQEKASYKRYYSLENPTPRTNACEKVVSFNRSKTTWNCLAKSVQPTSHKKEVKIKIN